MAMKQPGKKTYRTMQGKQIDMEMLRKKNELTPAVGNAKVNARGDELGAGGKIIRKREDIVNDYYKSTQSVPEDAGNVKQPKQQDVNEAEIEAEVKATSKKKAAPKTKSQPKEQEPTATEESEWEEDDNGDFIKKGE